MLVPSEFLTGGGWGPDFKWADPVRVSPGQSVEATHPPGRTRSDQI